MADKHAMSNSNVPLNGDEFSPEEIEAAQVTAFALGELAGDEQVDVKARIVGDEGRKRDAETVRRLVQAVKESRGADAEIAASAELRKVIEHRLGGKRAGRQAREKVELAGIRRPRWRLRLVEALVLGAALAVVAALLLPPVQMARESARRVQSANVMRNHALDEQKEPKSNSMTVEGEVQRLRMMVEPRVIRQEEEEHRLGGELPQLATPENEYNRMLSIADRLPLNDPGLQSEQLKAEAGIAENVSRLDQRPWDLPGAIFASMQAE